MRRKQELLVGEWAVLALLCERPLHGYAIAGLMAPDGEVGQIWSLSQQLTYRTLRGLQSLGLAEVSAVTPGSAAPRRTEWTATTAAKRSVARWLRTPERRIRELRPNLLLKLHLLHRRGRSPLPLLRAQRDLLVDTLEQLDAAGADTDVQPTALIVAWRRAMAAAALEFVEQTLAREHRARDDRVPSG
ncbi:MAG: PadR family transcriptional regulator [Conexibacter sp.]